MDLHYDSVHTDRQTDGLEANTRFRVRFSDLASSVFVFPDDRHSDLASACIFLFSVSALGSQKQIVFVITCAPKFFEGGIKKFPSWG